MSECIFGLAEHLDLWPPEAGGVTCLSPLKDTSGEALQSSSMSSKQMHNMRRYESECSPLSGSLQGSQESLTGLINPPALPPRSPVTNRRSRILKGEEFDRESNANNNNSRGRCQSLSLYDRKHAKKNSSKEKLVPEIKRSSQVTEDMRGWAVRWKNSELRLVCVCVCVRVSTHVCTICVCTYCTYVFMIYVCMSVYLFQCICLS